MEEMKVLVIDTETTGLIESPLTRLEFQPHVIQLCAVEASLDSGKTFRRLETKIKPPRLDLVTERITKITGITQDALREAPRFAEVADRLVELIESSLTVMAHNLTFDMEMVDLEMRRLDRSVTWPLRRICTVEQTVHLLGYNASLTVLHQHLTGRSFEGAHTAGGDVAALIDCGIVMWMRDMI